MFPYVIVKFFWKNVMPSSPKVSMITERNWLNTPSSIWHTSGYFLFLIHFNSGFWKIFTSYSALCRCSIVFNHHEICITLCSDTIKKLKWNFIIPSAFVSIQSRAFNYSSLFRSCNYYIYIFFVKDMNSNHWW